MRVPITCIAYSLASPARCSLTAPPASQEWDKIGSSDLLGKVMYVQSKLDKRVAALASGGVPAALTPLASVASMDEGAGPPPAAAAPGEPTQQPQQQQQADSSVASGSQQQQQQQSVQVSARALPSRIELPAAGAGGRTAKDVVLQPWDGGRKPAAGAPGPVPDGGGGNGTGGRRRGEGA